VVSDIIQDDL